MKLKATLLTITAVLALSIYCLDHIDNEYGIANWKQLKFRLVAIKAEIGSAQAQYDLGFKYFYGVGTQENKQQAFEWWQKAAEQGNEEAQRRLGSEYFHGSNIEQDYRQAFQWYKKAAEQGDASAQLSLGIMYAFGQEMRAPQQAVYWLEKAAETDLRLLRNEAQSILKFMYSKGIGVKQDYEEAQKWKQKLKKAASSENDKEEYLLRLDDGILKNLIKKGNAETQYALALELLSDGQKYTAVEWLQLAAEQGLAEAQYDLGRTYHTGNGITLNYQQALEWYRKAAYQNNKHAQYNLGKMYYYGEGVEQDYQQALKWLQIYEADNEYVGAHASAILGSMYYDGQGVQQNYPQAFKYFQKAAENYLFDTIIYYTKDLKDNKLKEAKLMLGYMYDNGQSVRQNYQQAVKWYTEASEQGYTYATYRIGEMHYKGQGMRQDYHQALKWFKKADEQNNADAQYMLGNMYYSGLGVRQNRQVAKEYYGKACDNGNQKGCDNYKHFQ